MELRKDFFWGGATAANQYEGGYLEGGKGLSIADVERGARHGIKYSKNIIMLYVRINNFLFCIFNAGSIKSNSSLCRCWCY